MNRQLALILQKTGVMAAEQVESSLRLAEESNQPLRQVVLDQKVVTEEQLAEAMSQYLRVPYVRLAATRAEADAIQAVPEEQARRHLCVPVKKEQAQTPGRRPTLHLAMADPTDLKAAQEIEFATGCAVKPMVATQSEVLDAIGRYYAPEDWLQEFLRNVDDAGGLEILAGDEETETGEAGPTAVKGAPAVKLVNLIIQNAIKQSASDIHIEPGVNHLQIRYRVQGMLREYAQMPKWIQDPLVSRIKILATLDITERRVPQDGRIRVTYEDRDVDLRISTLPTHFGEKVVMRVLGAGQKVPPTSSLGLGPDDLRTLKTAADQPQGLVLVTGPTGSGKTTTLYAILNEKKSPDINIITVEDPIEFQLAGINQVQVNTKAGLTFAASLRSILRQDPDVILVGEIRDLETAEIAFHAAMTGHLVLSTLHTNSTTATVGRLLDLGVDPQLICSSVNIILAQRLLRKLCTRCKAPEQPPMEQLQRLRLEDADFQFHGAVGCDACGKTGYAGRLGVYELLRMTPAVRELVARKAAEPELREAAMRGGLVGLLDTAVNLVRQGITSVDEVLRVIQLQEEEVTRCPNCGTLIDREFAACPYCMHGLKTVCPECQQELKPTWRICPYCNIPIGKAAGEDKAARALLPAAATTLPSEAGAAAAGTQVASAPAAEEQPARPPRILVVDDDEVSRAIVSHALRLLEQKPEVIEAANGPDALTLARALKPDLLLLDVMMPEMDGFAVCQKLRADVQTAFVPILMLTANSSEDARTRGFLVGTDDFMGKPVSVPELHARVRRLLRRTYGL